MNKLMLIVCLFVVAMISFCLHNFTMTSFNSGINEALIIIPFNVGFVFAMLYIVYNEYKLIKALSLN